MRPSLADPAFAMLVLWAFWAITWFIAAIWSKRASARPGFASELGYRVLTAIGAVIFFVLPQRVASSQLWATPGAVMWALVGLEAAGFAFCWWARIHLGSLWSSTVTRKEGHRIVDTGPYAIVRHPIYTGIITALIATTLARGTSLAIVGAGLIILGLWMKARLEEQFLRRELGENAYDAYRRRVPMLVPFWPTSR